MSNTKPKGFRRGSALFTALLLAFMTICSCMVYAEDAGAAVMIVTHDSEALEYADVKFRMNEGKLLAGDGEI